MRKHFVYIDYSGLIITACQIAGFMQRKPALVQGRGRYPWYADAMVNMTLLRNLLHLAGHEETMDRWHVFGSFSSLWAPDIIATGFTPRNVGHHSASGREKLVDTSMTAQIVLDATTLADRNEDTITMVCGDVDFLPALEIAKDRYRCARVAFWGPPADAEETRPVEDSWPRSTAARLFAAADSFLSLAPSACRLIVPKG